MISIIIPVYNEEQTIKRLLEALSGEKDKPEIIIVDGGSTDKTLAIAQAYPVKIIHSGKGRSRQMNRGAQAASGDILLFLHADCLPEQGTPAAIKEFLNEGHIGGCLHHKIDSSGLIYRLIEVSGNLRAKWSKIFYGDQAIFVRREDFFKIGGFDEVDLFEDVLFSKKLKRSGKVGQLDKKATASARRWQNQGLVKATLINWLLTIGFLTGIPVNRLKKFYLDIR